ncbi:glycoside hydrolase family 3 C-terminal domain-containing protein [Kutzneria kofuensis]|uniref:glycoside hydrolase family 3 C-terminal domain-containing protein n=1 Tax=Kutzneria kofuensis TaxID=103725 RepID=UPI0031E94131
MSFRLTPLGLERGINKYVWIALTLGHSGPEADPERRIERAVAVARDADVAVVVVGTTDQSESEGFDRTTRRCPARRTSWYGAWRRRIRARSWW